MTPVIDDFRRPMKDELYRRPLYECWSLKDSKLFDGELPEQSTRTRSLVMAEAILWFDREQSPKWRAFL